MKKSSKKTSKTSSKASSKASPVTTHKFIAKKAYRKLDRTFKVYQSAGGVRALVVKSLPKSGATAAQVAATVGKVRKGYSPSAALNCLRWLATKGHVTRLH